MQLLDDVAPEDESSYKEDDDIDLNQCFEQLEQHVLRSRKRVDTRLQSIAEENSRLKDELEARDEELRVTVEEMGKVNGQLEEMRKLVEENDSEMRRQIENATKKIQKYKQRLQEKQAEDDDLNLKIIAAQEEGQEEE